MRRIFYFLIVIISVNYGVFAVFKQERAKVIYVNPKYAKDVFIFTYRENRNSPYLTTLNTTSLVPYSDNVTFRFEFVNLKLQAFPVRFDIKTCEGFKMKWVKDWLNTYSDIPLECPLQPGTFHISKFELPPKNFPFQFNNIDYTGKTTVFLTGTKEKICELSVELRFNNKNG